MPTTKERPKVQDKVVTATPQMNPDLSLLIGVVVGALPRFMAAAADKNPDIADTLLCEVRSLAANAWQEIEDHIIRHPEHLHPEAELAQAYCVCAIGFSDTLTMRHSSRKLNIPAEAVPRAAAVLAREMSRRYEPAFLGAHGAGENHA